MVISTSSVVFLAIVATVTAANIAREPSPPAGWGAPPPPSNVNVALSGELAASGSGWAAENHAEEIHVSGGWGVPANLDVAAGGEAVLYQDGEIVQVSSVDDESVASLNTVSVAQAATADEGLAVAADGLDITVGQSGWAGVAGEGASAAAGDTSITVS